MTGGLLLVQMGTAAAVKQASEDGLGRLRQRIEELDSGRGMSQLAAVLLVAPLLGAEAK